MALNTLINVSQNERKRAINRSRRMWQTDMESNMNTSREVGRIEGRAEGQREAILVMRKLNLSDEEIAKAYNMSVDAVRKIIDGVSIP